VLAVLPIITFSQNFIAQKLFEVTNQECKTDKEILEVLGKLVIDNLSMDLYGIRYLTNEKVYDILISGLLSNNSMEIKSYCANQLCFYLHPHYIKKYSVELNNILKECDKSQLRELLPILVYIEVDTIVNEKLLTVDSISLFEKAMLGDVSSQKCLIDRFKKEKDFLQRLYLARNVGCLKTKEALRVLLEEFADSKVYNNYIDYNSSKYIAILGLQYYDWTPLFNNLGKVCDDYLFYKNQYSKVDFDVHNAIKQKEYILSIIKYLKKKYGFKVDLKNDDFLEYFEAREIDYDE